MSTVPATDAPPSPLPRWRRWTRRAARWAIDLYAGYVLIANLLLSSGLLLHWIHAPQDSVRLAYSRAWSLWPGAVELRAVRLDITDHRFIQVEIGLDRASVRLDLLALPHRVVHFRSIAATGATWRLRALRAEGEALPGAGELPDLAQYPGPPRQPPPRPGGPATDVWTVKADAADVEEIREAWIDRVRWQGVGRAAGPFEVVPNQAVAIGPADVGIDSGTLTVGGASRATNIWGQIHGELHPLQPEDFDGMRFARRLDADVRLSGVGTGLQFLSKPLAPFVLSGGGGRVAATFQLRAGVVQAGSHIRVSSPLATVSLEGYEARGAVDADWEARPGPHGAPGSIHAEVSPFGLWQEPRPQALLRAKRLSIHGTSAPIDLADLRLGARLDVRLIDGTVDDLRPFAEQLGSAGFEILKGSAKVSAHYYLEESGSGHGDAHIETEQIEARALSLSIAGKLELKLDLRSFDVHAHTLDFGTSELRISDIHIADLPGETGWWMTLQLPEARAAMAGTLRIDSRLEVQARDARPLLEPLWGRTNVPESIRHLISLPDAHLTGRLQVRHRDVELGPFQVEAGGLQVRGRLRAGESGRGGALFSERGLIRVGIELRRTDIDVHVWDAQTWFLSQMTKPLLLTTPL